MCFGNSVCGFLQVNNRGITSTTYCECGNNFVCPMTWDPLDGQSVVQGKQDQYKVKNIKTFIVLKPLLHGKKPDNSGRFTDSIF